MDTLEQITAVFAGFANPKKRVFFGYLALSTLLAPAWLVLIRKSPLRAVLALVFNRKVLFSGSSLAVSDWMFSSLHLSHGEEELQVGLDASERSSAASLRILYLQPLRDISRLLRKHARTAAAAARRLT
ncbi:hypothetical protein [Leisingera sp.]|uniref:hypothetical protein n=1 Tax=Leisingera sp. TaxID=1879318 RepID=UPI002B269144|nr:hypothetical protein [Leisingera sp.]